MFWLRNKKNNFQLHTLIWGPGLTLTAIVAADKIHSYVIVDRWREEETRGPEGPEALT